MVAWLAKIAVISSVLSSGMAFGQQVLWQDLEDSGQLAGRNGAQEYFYKGNEAALRELLTRVPDETSGDHQILHLPMPDGTLSSYSIVESAVMAPGLAAKYPQIRSYKVYGIDDPTASGRVDMSHKGFRGMLHTAQGRIFIDPIAAGIESQGYRSRVQDSAPSDEAFECSAAELEKKQSHFSSNTNRTAYREPSNLMVYRLAVSATPEYINAPGVGGTLNSAMAEINTAINRVNQIYERDLGLRLVLVTNNDLLIDFNDTNNFSNNSGFTLLDENQTWIDSIIGTDNYDIGHIFSTGGGGIATLESVCDDSSKAQGVTGLSNPSGDGFYIDYVAHEIGHQFGAEHTFNGTVGSCSGNRNAATAFEPGSGSTIMGYTGLCGGENIQDSSDVTFHAGTIAQIHTFVSGKGNCNSLTTADNPNDPVAIAGVDRTIPAATPFSLSGSGSDSDGDVLSYQWDQMDTGPSTNATTLGGDFGTNALFRSYPPQSSGDRNFPALGTLISGQLDNSEAFACRSRDLNFRLTVRDQKSGQATDDIRVRVDDTAGPFRITSHNTNFDIFANSGAISVKWNVAGTNGASVNCQNVDIDLLTFAPNHLSYSVTSLVANTPNDGSQLVNIPDSSNPRARFRVACSDNIFYDISDGNLDIRGTGTFPTDDIQTFFNSAGLAFSSAPACSIDTTVVEDDFEPNNDLGSASPLAVNTLLNGFANDEDWYEIDVTSNRIIVDLSFLNASSDLDLYLIDSSGATIAESFSFTDDEQINRSNMTSGKYYLRVISDNGYRGTSYTLSWRASRGSGGSGATGKLAILILFLVASIQLARRVCADSSG